jgi:hypothetical protein
MEKPDHYENGNQLEEDQKEEADETTTNQVFFDYLSKDTT